MPNLLVQVTSGPEAPTKAALAFLVARTAAEEGHDVSVFLGGDAVQLLRDATLDAVQGVGTGSLRQSFDGFVAAGGRIYASGMSSKARAIGDAEVAGKPVELILPTRLVQLTFEADRILAF